MIMDIDVKYLVLIIGYVVLFEELQNVFKVFRDWLEWEWITIKQSKIIS